MLTLRRGSARFHTELHWLDSRHTFSFGEHYDPAHMGFRTLRVINEDRVQPGAGFPPHPHHDMEILSYVLDGELAHEDNMGNGSTLRPGDVQRMSAGRGVVHSEWNASARKPVHFLQIWLLPETKGATPSYEEKSFAEELRGKLRLIASRDGRQGSVRIHQDVDLFAARLGQGQRLEHGLRPTCGAWVQLARGAVTVNGQALVAGDGAALSGETAVALEATSPCELLLFDIA